MEKYYRDRTCSNVETNIHTQVPSPFNTVENLDVSNRDQRLQPPSTPAEGIGIQPAAVFTTSASGHLDEALVAKLLESLHSLRIPASPHSSLSSSTVSSSSTAEGDSIRPASPAGVLPEICPSVGLTREHSSDCLAAALRQLSINQTHGFTQRPPPTAHFGFSSSQATHIGTGDLQPLMPQPAPIWPPAWLPPPPAYGFAGNDRLMPPGAAFQASAAYWQLHSAALTPCRTPQSAMGPGIYYPENECLAGPQGCYQSYCRQFISHKANDAALRLLHSVKAQQTADHTNQPFSKSRRFCCSLKEVSKVVGESKLLLIAPDIRPSNNARVRPVELLQAVMDTAAAAGVPYVFCLSRRGVGSVFGREKNMSIVAVTNLEGVERDYATLLHEAALGREQYIASHASLSSGLHFWRR